MEKQVVLMQSQTKILEKSVAVATDTSLPHLALYKFAFLPMVGESAEYFYKSPRIKLELWNYGHSPAILKNYFLAFSWNEAAPAPKEGYEFSFNAEEIVKPGDRFIFTADHLSVLGEPLPVDSKERRLVCSGRVTYGDVFKSPLRTLAFSKHLVEYDSDPSRMMVIDYENFFADTDFGTGREL
jgi:hypothetical protein